jgi:glycosyltransferase involved in cell wall biosynthesis
LLILNLKIVEQELHIMIKISYVPFSYNNINPGYDLRNIILYSKLKKIKIEKINLENHNKSDIIVLPPTFDPTNLEFIKNNNAKIIYQLVDNYLSQDTLSFKNIFRGPVNYLSGQSKKITFNFKSNQKKLCQLVDAVICSSQEQKQEIIKYNKNCHIFFEGNFHISNSKIEKKFKKNIIKLVWEGRSENLINLRLFKPVFDRLIDIYNIELHIVSDLSYPLLNRINFSSIKLIKNIFGSLYQENTTQKKSYIFFHQWNKDIVSNILKSCDLAIVPLDISNKFLFGKSMNKVILMWKNNLPVVSSNIDSYQKLSNEINHPFCCSNTNEWVDTISKLIENDDFREIYIKKIKDFITINYSKEKFVKQWDDIFNSVL